MIRRSKGKDETRKGHNLLPVGISFGIKTTCTATNGICTEPPAPMPARIWYPIHLPAPELTPRVYRSPAPTVKMAVPTHMNGVYQPNLVMLPPMAMEARVMETR